MDNLHLELICERIQRFYQLGMHTRQINGSVVDCIVEDLFDGDAEDMAGVPEEHVHSIVEEALIYPLASLEDLAINKGYMDWQMKDKKEAD